MKKRYSRRSFLDTAAMSLVAVPLLRPDAYYLSNKTKLNEPGLFLTQSKPSDSLGEIKQIACGDLSVGYAEVGPKDGKPVLLLHGWPYDIHSYAEVAPILARNGCRVIVPYLRGHGSTRFLHGATPRSGQQAAIGKDVIDLMDALKIDRAILAGYDWGGRAACVVAALWSNRCEGLVSVNGYLIQNIAKSSVPISPMIEAGFWYQYYFLTERGEAGLKMHRTEIARFMWIRNSPKWDFDDSTFKQSALAFENPDYVDVVIHSYRHRLGHAKGYPAYQAIENRLAAIPTISVPSITIDGTADGVVAATDGKASAKMFTGGHQHRIVEDAGHNLPQERPGAFAAAVLELF